MATVKWWGLLADAFKQLGKPFITVERYPQIMQEAGFEEIHWEVLPRPTNDWARCERFKAIGRTTCLTFLDGLEGFTMAPLTRVLGWGPEEVLVLCAQARIETMNRAFHGWQKG
jgi:hypothetical protein